MHGHACRGHGVPAHPESASGPCTRPVPTAPPPRPHGRAQYVCNGDHGVSPGRAVGEQSPTPRGTRVPGVPDVRQEYIHRRVVVAAVKALTEFLQVRRALAPHSFPLDRHESEGPSGSVDPYPGKGVAYPNQSGSKACSCKVRREYRVPETVGSF
eukprot:2225321-Rhodomonas_salina.1